MKLIKTQWIVILSIISAVLTIMCLFYINVKAVPRSQSLDTEFSATIAFEHVKYLAEKIGPRPAGSKAELKAAQYIAYILSQNGWKVREQPFSKVIVQNASVKGEQTVELINSQNVIAELPGTLPDTVVLGAHYDTATLNVPGAVDNASGVGVLLELARILSKEPHHKTYQLVFFGAEENGLVGSKFYASQADLSALEWMVNVDMVGTPMEIDVAGKKSASPELVKQVSALAKESNIPYHVSRDFAMMTRDSSQGGSSDFSSLLDQGIPAIGLGTYGRPPGYFHRPEDRLDHVSLENVQTIGSFTYRLVKEVNLQKLGPQVWDELYLSFQVGRNVFILPSYGVRGLIIAVLIMTMLVLSNFIKNTKGRPKLRWKNIIQILGVAMLISVTILGISGLGEILWGSLKKIQVLYYAYPELYLMARVGICISLCFLIANWANKFPLTREPTLYWFIAALLLVLISLVMALIRVDLAFPFIFWLFCIDLQFFVPSYILVFVGPYFLFWMHYELLNSEQWLNFYEAIHKYPVIFLGIYSLLFIPYLLAACHIAGEKSEVTKRFLVNLKIPALIGIGLLVLSLGLVPSYTNNYPQGLIVREEWSGTKDGKIHIFSNERLPKQLINDLGEKEGNSIEVPLLHENPPLSVATTVEEKSSGSERKLDIALKLNYVQEPYLLSLKLKSDQPFEAKTDEFLPMTKLPKKLQLVGERQLSGDYSLLIQRTPPQKNTIHLIIDAHGIVTCSIEGIFPCPNPRLQIQNKKLSIDYECQFKENYTF